MAVGMEADGEYLLVHSFTHLIPTSTWKTLSAGDNGPEARTTKMSRRITAPPKEAHSCGGHVHTDMSRHSTRAKSP